MQQKLNILNIETLLSKDLDLKKGQILTCSHTFQVKIINIHKEEGMIEFVCIATGQRHLLPMSAFEKIIQTLH